MTREDTHDDVCWGRDDGCDCQDDNRRRCDVCLKPTDTKELTGNPPLCEDCLADMAAQGYEPCLHCGLLCEGPLCSQECEDAERLGRVA